MSHPFLLTAAVAINVLCAVFMAGWTCRGDDSPEHVVPVVAACLFLWPLILVYRFGAAMRNRWEGR